MTNFYADLPSCPAQVGLVGLERHVDAPRDWSVAVVDIAGSTEAIARGAYKDVNTAASCAIIAALNAIGRAPVPYMFGGDGATILIPSAYRLAVAQALHGAQAMAQALYGLHMRAGLVPLADLGPVRVAKLETSPGVYQTALSGDGVSEAETLVKTGPRYDLTRLFTLEQLNAVPASFEGLECRWQPLASRHGEDVSLIVQARGDVDAYREILAAIDHICGPADQWQPAHNDTLAVSLAPHALMREARVRTLLTGGKWGYLAHTWLMALVGRVCFLLGLKAGAFDGRTYKRDTALRSDYIKFDNALRLVMDVTPAQKAKLSDYLSALFARGRIYFGLHSAPSALMTCMVFDYADAHFHFIDAANGGYAMAARQLKAQMRNHA